jgi:hypothetical protein
MAKESRRHHRLSYSGPVLVSWQDRGETRFARGKCLDIGEGGLRLELPVAVPAATQVSLRLERIRISGSARVRHTIRYAGKYLMGVELSQALEAATLESMIVREHASV